MKILLATVVHTQGSVYRRPGARLLVTAAAHRVGAISGGCLEADLVEQSRSLLTHGGAPILVRYDTTARHDLVFGLGLGCNGVVDVLLEAVDPAAERVNPLTLIRACLDTQQPGAIATVFAVENLHLMEENKIKQADLVGKVGSSGVVSEIINGKRGISKAQAKALGKIFHVSPSVFI